MSKLPKNGLKSDSYDADQDSYTLLSPQPINEIEFITWTLYLDKKLRIAIKGDTKNGFERVHSIQKRLSNSELIDSCNNKFKLIGTITITTDLPEYIADKFKNGFPEDWEIITSTWVEYVCQGKPIYFCWSKSNLNADNYSNDSVNSLDESINALIEKLQNFKVNSFANDPMSAVSNEQRAKDILSQIDNFINILVKVNDIRDNVKDIFLLKDALKTETDCKIIKQHKFTPAMSNLINGLGKLNDNVKDISLLFEEIIKKETKELFKRSFTDIRDNLIDVLGILIQTETK